MSRLWEVLAEDASSELGGEPSILGAWNGRDGIVDEFLSTGPRGRRVHGHAVHTGSRSPARPQSAAAPVAWPSVQVPAIGFASIHRPKAVQERLHRRGRGAEGGRLRAPSLYRR